MPSDPRVARALDMLAPPVEAYRSAVAMTLEEVRGHLVAGRADQTARSTALRHQLGRFADQRLDATRLSALLGDRHALEGPALDRLHRASAVLGMLLDEGDGLFHAAVPAGGSLSACVDAHLAKVGRAFAAARIASAARNQGAPSGLNEEVALERFPFGEWSAGERRLAPPLVVTVHGADLVAGALAPFVDGLQKLLLIVDGGCSPAPLVRLISPGVLVIQAHELEELSALAERRSPAVGALLPVSAVRFVHDPDAGAEPWQRLSISTRLPSRIARVGPLSAAQQTEEFRQLETLAAPPVLPGLESRASSPRLRQGFGGQAEPRAPNPEPRAASPESEDLADRLAAWLLQQANLAAAAAPGD